MSEQLNSNKTEVEPVLHSSLEPLINPSLKKISRTIYLGKVPNFKPYFGMASVAKNSAPLKHDVAKKLTRLMNFSQQSRLHRHASGMITITTNSLKLAQPAHKSYFH